MAVQRFRSFRAARIAQWLASDDPRLPKRIRAWWASSARFVRVHREPGVHRYRSIEEANAAKDALRREPLARPLDEPRER